MHKYKYAFIPCIYSEKTMSNNPLVQAYRKPALYVSLPSNGRFYDPKPKLSVDNELAVYAMTARDELISKTPDALFNGEATVALIKSCCPDIADPTQIPVSDLLVLMIAIRSASYGHQLDVDMRCPECNHVNMLAIDTNRLLGSVHENTASSELKLDNNFKLEVRPYSLEDRTLLQIQQVKQQKLIQNLTNAEIDDVQRNKLFGETFVEIADLTVKLVLNCIDSVQAPDSDAITDKEMIGEWLTSISKADYDVIKNRIDELSDPGMDNKFKAQCSECKHTWTSEVELDLANFFAG